MAEPFKVNSHACEKCVESSLNGWKPYYEMIFNAMRNAAGIRAKEEHSRNAIEWMQSTVIDFRRKTYVLCTLKWQWKSLYSFLLATSNVLLRIFNAYISSSFIAFDTVVNSFRMLYKLTFGIRLQRAQRINVDLFR